MQYMNEDDDVGNVMSNEDIDLKRVIDDPQYRREVIQFLNTAQSDTSSDATMAKAVEAETVN